MKLSISNLAWNTDNNELIYKKMQELGFVGLEIAPTKIFPSEPYSKLEEAESFKNHLNNTYGLSISSMQSIWYGITGNIFEDKDQPQLIDYTKKSILFANKIGCTNIVFGSPKNRIIIGDDYEKKAIYFFNKISEFGSVYNVVVSIEPNPPIYGTDFINTTFEAFDLVMKVNNPNFKVNLDLGTIIENNENVEKIFSNVDLINHIHISEPFLRKIEKRELHSVIFRKLKETNYNGYVSIEMNLQENINDVIDVLKYVSEVNNENKN